MLVAYFELINPGALTAGADAKTKAGQVFVEDIASLLPLGRSSVAIAFCVSFMEPAPRNSSQSWEDYGKIRTAFSCSLLPSID